MISTPPSPLIQTSGLTRIYSRGATEVTGLDNVDLTVSSGDLIVLKGNSGSGKSTLLSLMAGLDTPTSGRLTVAGEDLVSAGPKRLTRYRREVVGMVFQSFNLMPTLTVFENVCLPGFLAGRDRDAVESGATEFLSWLNMDGRRNHLPSQLSGGEMQRTAIARSLINDPALLLADEPTGNLDSRNGEIVMELLARLNRERNRTLIIATHSDLADPYATRILQLRDGMLVAS